MDLNVKRLLKDLSNSDDDLRALSAMTLMKSDVSDQKLRSEAIKCLMKATKDRNVSVRFFSRRAIDKLKRQAEARGEVPVPPGITSGLSSESFDERVAAVMQIAREEKAEFKDQLVEMLKSEQHDFVKASLISCLKKFITREEAGLLSEFLSDPDNRVRSNAIEAVEYLKAEDAIPALFTALEDSDNRIRAVAAKALATFGEEKVFTVLKKMMSSEEEWMRGSAIHALSHIYSSDSIKLLIEAARASDHTETRMRAIISLANYNDLVAYEFLRNQTLIAEQPFKEIAGRAIRLFEEKYGIEPPQKTIVLAEEPAAGSVQEKPKVEEGVVSDITGTVSRFFRKGRDEAVGMAMNIAINYALTDLEKERKEVFKEIGRLAFDMYQQGELSIPQMLTIGHEILRMNFFIQKYSGEEENRIQKAPGGFFAGLKKLFSSGAKTAEASSQVQKFTKKREDLFESLGKLAFKWYSEGRFSPPTLEAYFSSVAKLDNNITKEKNRTKSSG